MRKHILTIVPVLCITTYLINTVNAGYFSSICKLEDSECIKKTAQAFVPTFAAGIPEIGVEKCDPWFIKSIDLSVPNLKLKLTDTTVTGLRDTIIKSIRFDETKTNIFLKIQTTVQIEGEYNMKGKLLILPIEGKGPVHAKLRKLEITVNAAAQEKIGKDGKSYWHFEYKNHTFTLKDKSDVEFENLFDGDATLASATKELMANSGNEIIYEVAGPVIQAVTDGIIIHVNELCDKIPLDELRLL